ncbi:hypothetical protein [Dactylosporangium sp. NPDC050588]|uniref:hypothetical protein n=1 Tax=Dactylosporangium sp. NPDC050588 TaxID=3157211 RepID=UPI0033FF4CDA
MLFAFRLSFLGKAVHRIFISGGQDAFLEGHVHAFTTLGGVPTGKIVLGFAQQRVETARWTAFRSHFGAEAWYCQPGLQGAAPQASSPRSTTPGGKPSAEPTATPPAPAH